ncbi:hypothetical protein BDY21DRAFT_330630 [Lineolata rhizophorae]|uniref:Ams2/SPT21 N-terminal domain-containing protein n=1 Tax=Lineolata rhizophorae TaxID=578093 RepID=A0A6A6PEL4_9PEZI|nr:hypothetical protein BDY21DRAFT_330630 [Lineolata rhizophorae]
MAEASDIPRRQMRVKVLYTFDDESKTVCLARLPTPINVPVVTLDEGTQIGVVELRTCIDTIVGASPEIIAKLGQDFTVYAYDFSEYETPLVGQGMLSWVLASASSTPNAPANQSKTMITGKVTKNVLGLFNNGVRETLEVKLKLVPVPHFLQSEYVESIEKYRSLSRSLPEGFDHSAWSNFLKENPNLDLLTNPDGTIGASEPHPEGQMGGADLLHDMLAQSATPPYLDQAMPFGRDDGGYMSSGDISAHGPLEDTEYMSPIETSVRGSLPASPTFSVRSGVPFQQAPLNDISRPNSRQSIHSQRPSGLQRSASIGDVSGSISEREDDGPSRKRAKITQTDWRGKSVFGANKEPLRITASTAASIRGHRPIPGQASEGGNSLEPPPRAPTPRPDEVNLPRVRSARPLPSSLRRNSSNSEYVSPYNGDQHDMLRTESANDWADDEQGQSANGSPEEFPSSPPEMQPSTSIIPPSSPRLPAFGPLPSDSGFASDMVFDHDTVNSTAPGPFAEPTSSNAINDSFDADNYQRPRSRTKKRSSIPQTNVWTEVVPGPPELLPTKTNIIPKQEHPMKKAAAARRAAANAANAEKAEKAEKSKKKKEKEGKAAKPSIVEKAPPVPIPRLLRQSSPFRELTPAQSSEQGQRDVPSSMTITSPAEASAPMAEPFNAPSPAPGPTNAPTPVPETSKAPTPAEAFKESTPMAESAKESTPGAEQGKELIATTEPAKLAAKAKAAAKRPSKKTTESKPKGPASDARTPGDTSQDVMSDDPNGKPSDENGPNPSKPKSGSGIKRRLLIEERLKDSILRGEMPPYCGNCGAVSTPTWRKVYVKHFQGSPEHLQLPDEKTGIVHYEVTRTDDEGSAVEYRAFKKVAGVLEDGPEAFVVMLLCNPCGLWFNNKTEMRPFEQWDKSKMEKKKGRPKKKKKAITSTDAVEPSSAFASDPILPTDAPESSEVSEPANDGVLVKPQPSDPSTALQDNSQERNNEFAVSSTEELPHVAGVELPPETNNSTNGWDDVEAIAALKHALESSPASKYLQSSPAGKYLQSLQGPINVDKTNLTPRPTNRVLFPSSTPRSTEGDISKDMEQSPFQSGSSKGNKVPSPKQPPVEPPVFATSKSSSNSKEGTAGGDTGGADAEGDDFAHLFESPYGTHTTPRASREFMEQLKTPTPVKSCNRDHGSCTGNELLTPQRQSTATLNTESPELTPFGKMLRDLISDGKIDLSPSTFGMDFSQGIPEEFDGDVMMGENGEKQQGEQKEEELGGTTEACEGWNELN